MRSARPSPRQLRYLQEARAGTPRDVVYSLFRLIVRHELGDDKLSPAWRVLWNAVREQVDDIAPSEIISQIDEAMATVAATDERISAIRLRDEDKIVLLLGAGASAPEPSSIPTVNELLPELWRRAQRIGREDIDRLAKWCEEHEVSNIEDLPTAAYVANFAAKNASVTGLLDYFLFRGGRTEDESAPGYRRLRRGSVPQVDAASIALLQDTLQTLFGLLMGTMIPAQPNSAHRAIVEFLRRHDSGCILTTNYDGCIDEAFLRADLPFNTLMKEQPAPPAVCLIKIHGSISWSYCDSCQEAREFELLNLKDAYDKDTVSYPVIGICKACGGQRRPLLLPPMGLKFIMFPNLIKLWDTARQRIEEADYILVVGYSFSEADTYLSKIISGSMTAKATQTIIVCDPNPDLVPALRSRFAAHIDNFAPERVLQGLGGCEKLLPEILESLLSTSPPEQIQKKVSAPKRRRGPGSGRNTANSRAS